MSWPLNSRIGARQPRGRSLREARDFAAERPEFALAAGMTALRGIANGWGYDITGADVLDAYAAVMAAAGGAGVDEAAVKADVRALIAAKLASLSSRVRPRKCVPIRNKNAQLVSFARGENIGDKKSWHGEVNCVFTMQQYE